MVGTLQLASAHWRAAGASVIGARHVAQGQPCQDAVHGTSTDDLLVLAVADGHGDRKHALSEVGAQVAVEVATEVMAALGSDLLADLPAPGQVERSLRGHLPRRIQWEWNRRVRAHAGHPSPSGEWHEDTALYGTTLIAALFVGPLGVFLRLGDGDVVLCRGDGHAQRLFEDDASLYGSQTHSLCQPDGAVHAEVACRLTEHTSLVVLSTDGVRDSLEGEGLTGVATWLAARLGTEPWDDVVGSVPEWLGELSRLGNGDDVTLGAIRREGGPWPC